jgi:hypothetical protein
MQVRYVSETAPAGTPREMTPVLHIVRLIPAWRSVMWRLAVVGRQLTFHGVSLPRLSSRWLLEFEIASSRHLDE